MKEEARGYKMGENGLGGVKRRGEGGRGSKEGIKDKLHCKM